MLQSFPLLALSLVSYALLNLAGRHSARPWYEGRAFNIELMSNDVWHVSGSDVFLLLSMVLLSIEIVRATRNDVKSIANHGFSAIVFVAAMILFLAQPGYGNSTFCIFVSMTLLDFMAGFIITAVTARRDITLQRIGYP
ncbi:MAG: hypothetical protein RL701_8164 [Pseudomonadota bacterium]|jgi:hypothetical protein